MELIFVSDSSLRESIRDLDFTAMDYPWTQEQWEHTFQDLQDKRENSRYRLIIEPQKRGFALFEYSRGEWSHLLKVVTHPEHRSRSIASSLLKFGFDYFAQDQCKTMTLEVMTENKVGLHLYKKLGFRQISRINSFYSDSKPAYKMITELSSAFSAAPS